MGSLQALLSGKKTYIVTFLMLLHQVLGHYLYGAPWNVDAILTALGLSTLRIGVTKS